MNKLFEKFKINTKLIKNIDFSILIVVFLIVAFGIVNIYSAIGPKYAMLQFCWMIAGMITIYFI